MASHKRVKDVDYDGDDMDDYYSSDEHYENAGGDGFTEEDRENFSTLKPVVRAELHEAGLQAEDKEIDDALWHYFWDVGKSVTYLKNVKQPKTPATKTAPTKEKAKSKFDQAQEESAKKSGGSGNATPKQSKAANSLQKKTEKLSLDSTPPAPIQPKVKSKNLDVPKLWAEAYSTAKPSAAFVVIGHVDHGKSTLMGRLLLDTGAVPQRDIDKYRKEATEQGKGSFALAWVMDTSSDERERGVTVDIAQHFFSTDNADFAILDAPGHRDFVPNMIGGAAMADLGVLVVDANQLESGLRGQTKEHVLLARAVGLERMIVAVNKMDGTTPEWNQGVFEEVSSEVTKLLRDTGFEDDKIKVVPCSGLSGENVADAPSSSGSEATWVAESCDTLTTALESMAATVHTSPEAVKGPLRMQITDIFRGSVQNPFSVSGRVASGNVQAGDIVQVQPRGEQALVKSVDLSNEPRDYAVAGQLATLHLDSDDMESLERNLRAGDTLCLASKPVPVVKEFHIDIDAIGTLLPSGVDVHIGRLHVPGRIAGMMDMRQKKGGDIVKKKPRVVMPGQLVKVKVVVEEGVAVESGSGVVLRSGGETVGRGVVA